MRLPLFWLTDYVDPGLEASELAARLAMTGTEVDRVHTHGVTALDYFVVGRVLEREQHPDADRLSVCRVSTGEGDVAQIVCGAPNVAAGQTVGVALPGAVMPDGTKLKRAKLRGVVSEGMILAEDEVSIGTDHDGIMVLDDDLLPGHAAGRRAADRHRRARARDHAQPAGLPVGLRRRARGPRRDRRAAEPAAVARRSRARPATSRACTIEVEAPDLCPRFTARLFEDVKLGPSPPWLKARLIGRRPAPDQQRRRHHQLRDAAHRASRCTRSTGTSSPAATWSSAAPATARR